LLAERERERDHAREGMTREGMARGGEKEKAMQMHA